MLRFRNTRLRDGLAESSDVTLSMKKIRLAFVCAILFLAGAQNVFADDENEEKKEWTNLTAAWIDPVEAHTPSWLQKDASTPLRVGNMEIVAANDVFVIVKEDDQYVLMSDALQPIGVLSIPGNTKWVGIDENNRIFAYDGGQLLYADSLEHAFAEDGFQTAMKLEGVQQIDNLGTLFVYADTQKLVFADLDSMQTTQTLLRDFFDDERVAQMTPDAVENANNAKNKSSKTKTKANSSTSDETLPDIDVQTLVIRHDGVVVLKLHRMLQTRVFISKDHGRSWTRMEEAPNTIVRQLGWIWDGKKRVLSADASQWIEVCGESFDPFERFVPADHPMPVSEIHLSLHWPESPVVPSVPEEAASSVSLADVSSLAEATPQPVSACVPVEGIPVFSKDAVEEQPRPVSYLFPRSLPWLGARYYFTHEGTLEEPTTSVLWKQDVGGVSAESIDLPEGCDPLFVGGEQGLGVLLCRQGDNASQIYVYARSEATGWFAEATIPQEIGINTRMAMSSDGTLILRGDCQNVVTPAKQAVYDENGEVIQEAEPETTQVLCSTAVRDSVEIGDPEAWRIERIHDVIDVRPYQAGRLLALTSNEDHSDRLMVLSRSSLDTAVESFDATPYDGVEMTEDGCFALYDASGPQDEQRLLTPSGRLANVNCATARELTLAQRDAIAQQADWVAGDNRFGMRLGAGAFIASGIQTWTMRVEGLFPIYGGNYEVGLIFRMAGGNESTSMGYMGLITARWRYDGLEKFDFAVGAGVGYGQLTGYVKKTEENEEGEIVETSKSESYRKANSASLRYLISGIAAYRLAEKWKLYINAELIGGGSWGLDIGAGIEIRF